jgi:preprotein translocase subunit SecF
MELFKTPHIQFMKYKFVALAVSAVIVLAGILNMTVFHGLKPGVDFGGGTLIRVEFKDPTPVGQVRKQLADGGLGSSVIQETGKKGYEYQIRTTQVVKDADQQQEMEAHEQLANKVIEALRGNGGPDKLTVVSRETVGPQVGKDLRKKATQATIWALIGMLIYIAVRFKIEYGVAAIFTLTQDVLISISIFSFTSREINLPIIAALLTIVGFSINDTIVIFDRVRENSKLYRKESLEEIMNLALNQCLGRTIITSGTVFLTLLALYIFGGKVINDFAFIMLIGTIEGVYSTVYLSCPVVIFWQKFFKTKKGFRR